MNTAITLFSLLIGAVGALTAIYLKEAVQQAILRRTLAWQLFGHLLLYKKQILRNDSLFAIYEKVKAREVELRSSLANGTEAFSKKLQEQNSSRAELQLVIRETINSALVPKPGEVNPIHGAGAFLGFLQANLAQQRKDLVDGKVFLSDRDAAQLGKSVALNVVQCRAAMHSIILSMENLPTALQADEQARPAIVKFLIDLFVVQGEDFMESLVRLERATDRISKQSLLRLTWEVLASD